jgi:uncharacterized protein with PIN domain
LADRSVKVFDACAIIAWLQGEDGAGRVSDYLADPSNRCLVSAINACEVCYDLHRRGDQSGADDLDQLLAVAGFELVTEFPTSLWKEAGHLKANLRRVSLADCFAMALAIQEGGDLVTSDHHELDAVAASGLVSIAFIR